MWYVYKHQTPSCKVYIGITGRNPLERWQSGRGYRRNKHFYNAILKYGWNAISHEILCDGLTKEEAEAEEIRLIAEYNSTDPSRGYNKSTGGGCCTGYHWELTEEQKKHHTEARKKLYKSGRGHFFRNQKGEENNFYGMHHTEESRHKIAMAQYRPVLQITKDGDIIGEFDNPYQVYVKLGISHVRDCCIGRRKTAGGFVWKYKD